MLLKFFDGGSRSTWLVEKNHRRKLEVFPKQLGKPQLVDLIATVYDKDVFSRGNKRPL